MVGMFVGYNVYYDAFVCERVLTMIWTSVFVVLFFPNYMMFHIFINRDAHFYTI